MHESLSNPNDGGQRLVMSEGRASADTRFSEKAPRLATKIVPFLSESPYRRLLRWKLPPNMRAMMLPTLEQFRTFPARGPEGVTTADINGRAAAIECYLDLDINGFPPAKVVWTNYKEDLDLYHGALEHKESYTKAFLKQTAETVSTEAYCIDKLGFVLDALIAECCTAAMNGSTACPINRKASQ